MKRQTAYLDEATAEAVERERPAFLSKSGWLSLLIWKGLRAEVGEKKLPPMR